MSSVWHQLVSTRSQNQKFAKKANKCYIYMQHYGYNNRVRTISLKCEAINLIM